ncbi:multicopper oxidase domain-containing protein [Nocardia vinacea]|uniref:multicopper oxidase domain-containing protein n=1 Tax=Nocardia vinacea TaxID=96468 RepID=UPI0034160F46
MWEFVNVSPDAHPMHLHLVHMRINPRSPTIGRGWISRSQSESPRVRCTPVYLSPAGFPARCA